MSEPAPLAASPALAMSAILALIHQLTGHKPHRSAAYRWWLQGRLKGFKVGGRLYSTREDVLALLADRSRPESIERNARAEAAMDRIHATLRAERQAARRAPGTKRGGK